MILVYTSEEKIINRLLTVFSKASRFVELERADSIERAVIAMNKKTVDCFIVVEQRIKNGVLPGVKLIDIIRKTEVYRFTPVIYISDIPDPFGKVSNTYQLFAYLDSAFDPAYSKEIFHTAASYKTRIENSRFHMCVDGVTHLIRTEDIEYVRLEAHTLTVVCCNFMKLSARSRDNLEGIMRKLGSRDFVRCSRSYLCNVRYVEWIDKSNMYIGMNSGDRLKVGRNYKKNLIEKL